MHEEPGFSKTHMGYDLRLVYSLSQCISQGFPEKESPILHVCMCINMCVCIKGHF